MTTFTFPPAWRRRLLRVAGLAAVLHVTTAMAPAQSEEPLPGEPPRRERVAAGAGQDRRMANLREQLEVVDEGEWLVISGRIAVLLELRRDAAAGAGRARSRLRSDADRRAGRRAETSEAAKLQLALKEKLPDAEIQARLAQLRDTRAAADAKIAAAQEDLRALLSVRQEAVAVLNGLLP